MMSTRLLRNRQDPSSTWYDRTWGRGRRTGGTRTAAGTAVSATGLGKW
ncbi:hypothetical protein ACFPN0_02055 [Kitasatospora cinereorecta]